jgi:hypothetical protein
MLFMYRLIFCIALVGSAWPSMLFALEQSPPQTPDVNERLTQALGFEGGVQVYKDDKGNVKTTFHFPGGGRRVTVQPPQSPSMNLGPPLQLNNPPFQLPQDITPAHPPSRDFPQKAR